MRCTGTWPTSLGGTAPSSRPRPPCRRYLPTFRFEGATLSINGQAVDPVWDWCLTYPFNMLGHLPAASAPSGFSSSGVPTGLQIVGPPYDEAGVLRIASALERVRPPFDLSRAPLG